MSEHYYTERPKSPLNVFILKQRIMGKDFEFYTASGIFSKSKIDAGTLTLAENMQIKKSSKVLDIGCGIGVLGVIAAKLFGANVTMSDINKRAVMLARKNVKINNLDAEVFHGNLYEKINAMDFDVVLSNPPQNAGKEICFKIIEGAKMHLKDGGNLHLVARHNKGGKSLSEKMKDVFGNVKVIARKSGYFVYMSEK